MHGSPDSSIWGTGNQVCDVVFVRSPPCTHSVVPLAVAGRQGVKADRPAAQERESTVWPLICFHLEAGQTKTRAPEPPAGRFPKFLLPRVAGRPRKLKFTLSIPSPTPVRVVGGEWKSGGSRWNQNFQGLHMGLRGPRSANRRQGRRNKANLSF